MSASDSLGPQFESFRRTEPELVEQMHLPECATGVCEHVNGNFAEHLWHEHGIDAHLEDFRHRQTGAPHTVARVGDQYVDWTMRQFEPKAEVPSVYPHEEFHKNWEFLQHGYHPREDEEDLEATRAERKRKEVQ